MASEASAQLVLRVDKDQTVNTPTGLSWSLAYPNLQGALTEARTRANDSIPGNEVSEIWVAEGVYKPTASTTDRAATFRLVPEVEVYGGFLGNEQSRAARAGSFNLTILSGDIDGDPRNQLADSLHVVTVDEAGSFLLDGFQVMFGAAVPTVPTPPGQVSDDDSGGWLFVTTGGLGTVTVRDVRFQACLGGVGGGAFVMSATFNLSRSNFAACGAFLPPASGTTVPSGGGGALALFSCPTALVYNSTFTNNRASNGGAIVLAGNGEVRIVNSLIANNSALAGGGLFLSSSGTPVVVDFCTLAGNVSLEPGDTQSVDFEGGGAVYMREVARLQVRSSIVWGNLDQNQVTPGSSHTISGPGAIPVAMGGDPGVFVTYSDFDITVTPNWFATISGVSISQNNISANPQFVNAGAGNYRLLPGSPCIDAADDLVFETIPIPGGSGAFQWNRGLGDPLDIDGDGITAEFLPWDLDDLTRELDLVNLPDTGRDYAQFARIGDMGCYEQFLNEAPL